MALLTGTTKPLRAMNAQAAGTTTVYGPVIDMAGFTAVRLACLLGTLTAGQTTSLKVQTGNKADASDMADLSGNNGVASSGNAADGDSNKVLIVEADSRMTPMGRYVRAAVVRGTSNAAIDGVFADLHGASSRNPAALADATVSKGVVAS